MKFDAICSQLRASPKRWLVTGAAGFIGSNLVEFLLSIDQTVVGLDNFSTGYQHNLDDVLGKLTPDQKKRFQFINGSVCHFETCRSAVSNIDYILHQAAYGSVPKSIERPLEWNTTNIEGSLNMLVAARDANIKSFVYASSSSVYGDSPELPKVEEKIGKPLSPYAVTKYVNELYAGVFAECYEFNSIGLRYFNVFGPRQDPEGAYAAVIPKWITQMASDKPCTIHGDGETSRDFCYIKNVIQANVLAAMTTDKDSRNRVYNVGVGEKTSLVTLHAVLAEAVKNMTGKEIAPPNLGPFRQGDIRHSLADVSALKERLAYVPTHTLRQGVADCIGWYFKG